MFDKQTVTYMLYEGHHSNDNAMITEFKSKAKAIKAFAKSLYPYAVIHKYDGPKGDELANYRDTILERHSITSRR